MGARTGVETQPAGGLSRRAFVGGVIGAGGALGLAPAAALAPALQAGAAGLLFSTEHRALALSHGGRRLGLLSLPAGRSAMVVHTARRQFALPLGPGQPLRDLQGAWITAPGEFALLDGRAALLHRYSTGGARLGGAALPGRALLAAAGCADGAGGSFVSLPDRHRIIRLRADGTVAQHFGTLGAAPGALNYPTALARQDDGRLLVANTGNYRIDRFDAEGRFDGTLARLRFMPGQLALSGASLAVYDPHARAVLVLSLHNGQVERALPAPAMPAGAGRLASLTAAGDGRLLLSV